MTNLDYRHETAATGNAIEPQPASHPGWITLARRYPARWALPALLIATAAVAFAFLKPQVWEARQAFVVRTEGVAQLKDRSFADETELRKVVQETALELLRSRPLLETALKAVGPPAGKRKTKTFPDRRTIADLREAVRILPPTGSEFGETDIFYLTVRDEDPKRAMALTEQLAALLVDRFHELNREQTSKAIAELENAVKVARADLSESITAVEELETSVGADLAELRMLEENQSGESALRRNLSEVQAALRQTTARLQSTESLLELLREVKDDPQRIVATPNTLLESQPALRRLKDGLIDAELRLASLRGNMSDEHPTVISAKLAKAEIQTKLFQELDSAVEGLEAEKDLLEKQAAAYSRQLHECEQRLARLAELRTKYSTLLAEQRRREAILQRAESELSEARLQLAGNSRGPLLAVDKAETGDKPVGPSRAVIAAAGIAAGLLFGFAVFVWTVPLPVSPTAGLAAYGIPASPAYWTPPIAPQPPVTTMPAQGNTRQTPPPASESTAHDEVSRTPERTQTRIDSTESRDKQTDERESEEHPIGTTGNTPVAEPDDDTAAPATTTSQAETAKTERTRDFDPVVDDGRPLTLKNALLRLQAMTNEITTP
ncbi:MAG: hypothetical protein D6741_07945 [Planctomycetota bacterium]|nr:MAG: hypothetical protein D6741_07945 [Planctomycetota bacterium]